MKTMKKTIFAGLLTGLVMTITSVVVSMIFGFVLPQIQKEYVGNSIFRPWSDPLMSLIFVAPFLIAIILAILWEKHKNMLPGNNSYAKVMKLFMLYFCFSIIGMIITYSTFAISLLMVFSWMVSGFLQLIIGAWVLLKMIK